MDKFKTNSSERSAANMFFKCIFLSILLTTLAFSSCSDHKNGSAANQPVAQRDTTKPPQEDFLPVDVQPVPIKTVTPKYPELARRAGVEGTVWLKVLVSDEGKVKDVSVIKVSSNLKNRGTPVGLPEAAMEAARQWTFKPAMLDNKPVQLWVTIPFAFKLDNDGKKK
jgi:TonB family protein